MINRTTLNGRLTKDPDLRYTSNGIAVASFTLAVNRPFKNKSGEQEADFIRCVIWRKPAENFANFTHKGSLVGVDGRIQTRSYENSQGERVYITEVVVDNFDLLEPKQDRPDPENPQNTDDGGVDDPFKDNGQQIDISDDDLPF